MSGERPLAWSCGWGLACLLLTGCVNLNPLPGIGYGHPTPEERGAAAMTAAFSSRVEAYREFDTVFTARGLFLSPQVREAAAGWEAKTRLLDPGEKEALEKDLVAPGRGKMEFLLGFYTPREKENRLDAVDSPWKVHLRLSDGRTLRADCAQVNPGEADVFMRFLRWEMAWSRLYRICFNLPLPEADPAGKGVILVISGAGGSGEMAFRTVPPPPEP